MQTDAVTRAPMTLPQEPNQRWSLDFAADQPIDGQRFRVPVVADDFTRQCLAHVGDPPLAGRRLAGEFDGLIHPSRQSAKHAPGSGTLYKRGDSIFTRRLDPRSLLRHYAQVRATATNHALSRAECPHRVSNPPPLAPAKAFSRSGCGRIFPWFSRVMRDGLSTGPCARRPGSGLSGPKFSGPLDFADLV